MTTTKARPIHKIQPTKSMEVLTWCGVDPARRDVLTAGITAPEGTHSCQKCSEAEAAAGAAAMFKRGTRVRTLVKKQSITPRPGRLGAVKIIPAGTIGTVSSVDLNGDVHVIWPGGQLGYWGLTYRATQVELERTD